MKTSIRSWAWRLGADDFEQADPTSGVVGRIKALVRRANGGGSQAGDPGVMQFGRLKIDVGNREASLAGERIEFSPAEFDLPGLLALNAGKVVQRDEILKSLRGLYYSNADRSVDAHYTHWLRRRFGRTAGANWKIKTVRPHGYMFTKEPW